MRGRYLAGTPGTTGTPETPEGLLPHLVVPVVSGVSVPGISFPCNFPLAAGRWDVANHPAERWLGGQRTAGRDRLLARDETETVGGYTWTCQINGDTAEIMV